VIPPASAMVFLKCVSFFGPSWRMYYFQYNGIIIVMLGGGDKSSQSSDIAKAKNLAKNFSEI